MNMTPEERVAVISTKHGDMVVEFYPNVAPMHVESFIALAQEEYFNGTTFHRVIPGFVIQGGDPNSRLDNRALHGTGGRAGKFFGLGDENDPNTWLIPAEFNDIPHTKGILSMARTMIQIVLLVNFLFVMIMHLSWIKIILYLVR